MRKVRSTNTTPEMLLRRALWAKGLRYKVCETDLPGRPDVVLPSARLAVFIDGDLWHGHQWRLRGLSALEDQFRETKSKDYWLHKIRRNMSRDCSATASLMSAGWTVLRFWESEIYKNLDACIEITINVVRNGSEPNSFSLLPQKTFIALFACVESVSLGLTRQGWNPVSINNTDHQKRKTHNHHLVVDDIHKLSAESIPSATLVIASLSPSETLLAKPTAALHSGRSSALLSVLHKFDEMNDRMPPIVLLECGADFLTSYKGFGFEKSLLELSWLGYSIDALILNAPKSVKNSKRRLFIVGIKGGSEIVDSESSTRQLALKGSRPEALVDFIKANPAIRWRVRPLPTHTDDAAHKPMIEWIATYYLNPVVNELIHGRPLTSAERGV